GLNVLSGYTGQVSLGITFFMAIGAYTAAFLGGDIPTTSRDPAGYALSFLIWLPAAGIAAALVGALLGPTALRLKGFYLGIVSLGLVFIGQYVFQNWSSLSGGPAGRSMPAPGIGDFSFANQNTILGITVTAQQQFFLLFLVILGLTALFVGNVMRSRAGRAFQAVRDHEVGAAIIGVNLFEAKMGAFVLSSFLAGISGALLSSYIGYVRPDDWNLVLAIQFVAAIIVGGVASVWGSILGAVFVFALPIVLDQFQIIQVSATTKGIANGDLNALIYGALIIVFLLFEPGGVVGLIRRIQLLARRFNQRGRKGGEPAAAIIDAEPNSIVEVESTALSAGDESQPVTE
ncbi:MAG TPA: branched-chain amino acid ABC transporter permease, partial [Ktedonobacterales bacterium]